jgi:hypothetical protein
MQLGNEPRKVKFGTIIAEISIKKVESLIDYNLSRVIASNGLGNQLFQFCFAHFLTGSGRTVRFENDPIFSKHRSYLLGDLNQICSHVGFKKNLNISHTNILGRAAYKFKIADRISALLVKKKLSLNILESEHDRFLFNVPRKIPRDKELLYFGFWQHWKYVDSQMETAVVDINKYLSYIIKSNSVYSKNSKRVVIHVRRGDYLERGLNNILGVIKPESYENVLFKLKKEAKNLEIFTITNDFDLKKDPRYSKSFGTILDPSICNPWQALKLMADADYVIAANSTLSWWGGLLAVTKGGVGFIPNNFFKNLDSKNAFDSPLLSKYDVDFF